MNPTTAPKDQIPYPVAMAIKAVPTCKPTRQDSTEDQLQTVLTMAVRAGCYDAADWIARQMGKKG